MQSQIEPEPRDIQRDVKFIGDLRGSYLLASRENRQDGQPRSFACRSRSVSPQLIVLEAPVSGQIGESLALNLDTLGLLKASIIRLHNDGFTARLILAEKDAETLAGRIDWIKQHHLRAVPELRNGKRWLPRDSHSTLILADRRELTCFIIDVSTTGAAVSADVLPEIGHPIVVGAVLGRVIRRFDSGFAVQFLIPQAADRVEQLVAPVRENKRDLLAEALAAAEAMLATARQPSA